MEKDHLNPVYLSLIHSPVVNKSGERIISSVTNLDLHDIARSCRCFGIAKYFIVHPSPDQQILNRRILNHWESGYGRHWNPTRTQAFKIAQLAKDFDEVRETVQKETGQVPMTVGTSAKKWGKKSLSPQDFWEARSRGPIILVFGTASGLDPEWEERLDAFLGPIDGGFGYNHLSVRSAVAIYLDRLLRQRASSEGFVERSS